MQAPTAGARAEEQGEEVEEVEEEAVAASELGTRSYWRNTYEQELASFVESSGSDAGEVWFGEGTQATVVAFAAAVVDAHGAAPRASARVLDLGCGNGALCVALARAG